MRLCGDKPWVARQLDHFHDPSVRRQTGQHQALFGQYVTEIIVYLITVAVPFVNGLFPIQGISLAGMVQYAGIGAKS